MIDIDAAKLHPTYRAAIGPELEALLAAFPRCPLKRVEVYRGSTGDRSLGNADKLATINLNAYWFTDRSLEELHDEAQEGYLFSLPGSVEVLKWHGGMVELAHLLCHEFGHCLSDALPGYKLFAEQHWREATAAPHEAVSGYALAGADEWFGEAFAAMWLHVDHPSAHAMSEFLGQ